MAGVTIAALTGSDSAPSKANEASQKQDIGVAKDDVSLAVTNAITDAYQTAYVDTGVSAGEASTTVGTEVIKAIAQKYQTNNQIGKATIEIDGFGTISSVTGNATVTISTTDFVIEGTIYKDGGKLTWGEIEENKPSIKIDVASPLTINVGSEKEVTVIFKQIPDSTPITWSSNQDAKQEANKIITVTPIANTKKAKIKGLKVSGTETVTVTATAGEYSATIEVIVKEFVLGEPATGSAANYGKKVIDYKSNAESVQDEIGWRLFYQDTEGNTYLIADKLIGSYTPQNEWGTHTGANASAEGKGLNPLVKTYFTSKSGQNSIKATSWMTDTEVWSQYTDSEISGKNKATFAIASPTIELYTKSYNAVAAINSSVNSIAYPTTGIYGYTYSSWPSGLTDTINGIYAKSGKVWWIASPSSNNNYNCIHTSGTSISKDSISIDFSVRPIVCIPTVDFNSTYHLES